MPKQRQPRALQEQSLAIQPYYRAGMYAELQKFGKEKDGYRQLWLSEAVDIQDATENEPLEIYGLDFSTIQDRAFSALQQLLDKTGYKGNLPGQTVYSEAYKAEYFLPKLKMSFSEYLQAYGLEPGPDGRAPHGERRHEAIKALKSLAEPWRVAYKREHWTGQGKKKRKVADVIVSHKPLITLFTAYKDLELEEAEVIISGEDRPDRATIIVEFSPLFVDAIDTFYVLRPARLHEEIRALAGKNKVSQTALLFISWLLTLDIQEMKIAKAKLPVKLRMEALLKQRKPALINARLEEAFQIAKDGGWLLDYSEDGLGFMTLILNPEKCQRVRMKKSRKKSQTEA